MLCVSIFGKDRKELSSRLERAQRLADIIELRFDLIKKIDELELTSIRREISKPLIGTNRALWEGGSFQGPENERIDILREAAASGFDYVDIELRTEKGLLKRLASDIRPFGTKIILSYHDFRETPRSPLLIDIFEDMLSRAPDVIKIVTMANDELDFLRIAPLYRRARELNKKLIAFCMGRKGKFSRVFCLNLGSFLSFSCLDEDVSSAPGQIPITTFRNILELL